MDINSNSKRNHLKRKRLFTATPPKSDGKEINEFHLCSHSQSPDKKRSKVSGKENISPHSKLSQEIQDSIVNFGRKIKSVSEEEVDLDDPNSAFIRSEKMKSRLIRFASKCYEEKDVKPIYAAYKKIKLKSALVPFPSLVQDVEKFVNTSCIQYGDRNIPSISDVKVVIEKWNSSSNVFTVDDVNKYAEKVMKFVVSDIRRKRRKDLDVVLNKYIEVGNRDPAEMDPLLTEKLVRNEQSKIRIESLERSFMNKEEVRCEVPEIKSEPL